jgi:2-octaprenylphenol hydroxylase
MNHDSQRFDVVIIGGGIVGTTLACALRQSSLRIALIEPAAVERQAVEHLFDLRVSAITRASQRIFETLGVWAAMEQQRVSPFREMHVWDKAQRGEIHFDSAELGEPLLGHIIENRVMTSSLFAALVTAENVVSMSGRSCQRIQHDPVGWQIELDNGAVLHSTLVVGADGSHSWVRQQQQIRVRGWDYDHTALVTYVKTALPHHATAWQRFLPSGPLAFLPLTDGYSSIVWSTRDAHARELHNMPSQEFAQQLEQAFESRLGAIEHVGARAIFPLRFFMAEHYIGDGLALVGDAAHTVHPLAGQGVNLGLADAASLAQVIVETARAKRPIDDSVALRRYERWRRAENLTMFVSMDGLQRLFDSEHSVIDGLRNTGMWCLNRLPLLKNGIIASAMGNRGDLPKLARGEPIS